MERAARLVAAIYFVTGGKAGLYSRIDECAARAGISDLDLVRLALLKAAEAGFVTIHATQPWVRLTGHGHAAARWG